MKYLLQFLIGSSVFVFAWFFIFIYKRIQDGKLNTDYFRYTLAMPLYFGMVNVLGKIIQDYTKISDLFRYLLVSIVFYIALWLRLTFVWYDLYDYNTTEWIIHAFISFVAYVGSFTCIMNTLEKCVLHKPWEKNERFFVTGGLIVFIVTFMYTVFYQ